ncbi:hypothetical protein G7076_00610 [Sphingomonas sp. HDW15A]|uniref:hypothetical protein n=1 Tax=Sphingomonas sp. HDW15A TaxID=2714942 RepID=UPI00140814AF|nr:hypothetical protein [Sphingomonas sp. HDW15A]QIK95189.1 hypothetical protein G7076_00610 [Sphingomonas sp. HDW15A]
MMRVQIGLSLLAACAAVPLAAQSASAPASAEPVQAFDPKQAAAVVTKLATTLEENFVFPEVGKAYAVRLRQQLKEGAYSSFRDGQAFADKVTSDLQSVHKDGHLRLHVVPVADRSGPETAPGPAGANDGSTILKSGWLADGVAYINFRMFSGNEATMRELKAFLDSHRDAKTLIIDARQHRGGGWKRWT